VKEFIHEGKIVSKEIYIDILRRLRDAIRKNAAKNGESKASPSHQRSSSHADFVQDVLSENNGTTLQHPPSPADFSLFPRLRSALKGRRLCDANGIIKNETKS